MNIKQFYTIGYLVKNYFHWSMDYSQLEGCIADFFTSENEEKKEAFRKEVETLYALQDSDLVREVTYRLGDRGMSTKDALNMIKLLYAKTQEPQ